MIPPVTDYVARNTDPSRRGRWEVVNYRTGKRPAIIGPLAEEQGRLRKDEALRLAASLNRRMTEIERGGA